MQYDNADRERLVLEPPKRVDAPTREPFERDRARVVHAASSRRLAAKTQVVGPLSDDFVRNRLTHSLEVAQIARDLSRAVGSHPDLAETAALAHDLGHPPFGHNGETVLAEMAADIGGFEGNAQTLRLLTRLEAKAFDRGGRSAGLNLTRATLDACTKYPWARGVVPGPKFGVYDDDRPVFDWVRSGAPPIRKCVEAQIMDLADDVAYSVHDVEDGVVARRIDLTRIDDDAVVDAARANYARAADTGELLQALSRLRSVEAWPSTPYAGGRRQQAILKNLTSDLIGRFCGSVQQATNRANPGALARHRGDIVVPRETRAEMAVLKAIAWVYVMQADDHRATLATQRDLLAELVEVLRDHPEHLDPAFAEDWADASDDDARFRVVIDQVASLTDPSALQWHARLVGG